MKNFQQIFWIVPLSILFSLTISGCSSDEGPTDGNGTSNGKPKIQLTPQPEVYFGYVPSGQSAVRSFRIYNASDYTLKISDMSIDGVNADLFSFVNPVLPDTIRAYNDLILDILFQPSTTGDFAGNVNIISNAETSPDILNFSGRGSSSASGAIYFERIFRGNAESVGLGSDNGYILAGSMTDTLTLERVGALTRLDEYGNIIWIRGYAGNNTSGFTDLVVADDGGYVAVGTTGISIYSKQYFYIVKVSGSGDIVWEIKDFALGTRDEIAEAVTQTTDGGFIVAGTTENTAGTGGIRDALLIKIDAAGNVSWAQRYGSAESEYARSVVETDDQGFVFVGYQTAGSAFDLYMVRTYANGDLKWEKRFGGSDKDRGNSVIRAEMGDFIAAGYTVSEVSGSQDVFVVKVDSAGNLKWSNTYGGGSPDEGYAIIRTNDQGYLIAGVTESFGAQKDVYLIKTDNQGNLSWEKTWPEDGKSDDGANSIRMVRNEGYVVAGYTSSFSTGTEAYFLKVDNSGNIQ